MDVNSGNPRRVAEFGRNEEFLASFSCTFKGARTGYDEGMRPSRKPSPAERAGAAPVSLAGSTPPTPPAETAQSDTSGIAVVAFFQRGD